MPLIWKRGVVSKGKFADWVLSQNAESHRQRPFAFTLLADLEESFSTEDEALLQILYQSMEAADNIFKTTRCNRLTEVDQKLIEDLPSRFSRCQRITIHDMAASNAITSLNLYNSLKQHCDVSVHASDYYDMIYMVSPVGIRWIVVFDADQEPLQFVGHKFVISTRRKIRSRYPVNLAIEAWVRLTVLPVARKILDFIPQDHRDRLFMCPSGQVRSVWLFHPLSVAKTKDDPCFTLGRHNFFDRSPNKYHVVRVMNALNLHNFTPAQLVQGVRACATGLLPGSLFVLGRCIDEEDSRPCTTAFVLSGNRLVPTWDLYGGVDIRELVSQLRL